MADHFADETFISPGLQTFLTMDINLKLLSQNHIAVVKI